MTSLKDAAALQVIIEEGEALKVAAKPIHQCEVPRFEILDPLVWTVRPKL